MLETVLGGMTFAAFLLAHIAAVIAIQARTTWDVPDVSVAPAVLCDPMRSRQIHQPCAVDNTLASSERSAT